MDELELKRQYDGLTDDEVVRLWADQEGLTEVASVVLKEEIAKRGLKGEQFETRTAELRQQLKDNQQRFERHQKRVVWKAAIYFAVLGTGVIVALVRLLLK